jgi:hypothetical protein
VLSHRGQAQRLLDLASFTIVPAQDLSFSEKAAVRYIYGHGQVIGAVLLLLPHRGMTRWIADLPTRVVLRALCIMQ